MDSAGGLMPLFFLVGVHFAIQGMRFFSDRLIDYDDENSPRNPRTGVLYGAEPYFLGPVDSDGVVLFVHGFIGEGSNFHDFPRQIAELGWRVRVMRLPGHGTSPQTLENVDCDILLDAVSKEVNDLKEKYKKIVLIGHSMGGASLSAYIDETKSCSLIKLTMQGE